MASRPSFRRKPEPRDAICEVRSCDERLPWIPACAGMTRLGMRAVSLTTSESLNTNGTGSACGGHSRRDCPVVDIICRGLDHLQRDSQVPAGRYLRRYAAVMPPSMTSSLPVTNEDSSEAR